MKVWNTLKTTYKISDFVNWHKEKTLLLNPMFQRRSVWKTGAKSYLIDTIIRGFPIPIILLRDKKTDLKTLKPLRDVVDGQQRLRTVIAYIAPDSLDDFDDSRDKFTINKSHNEAYQGKSFKELPEEVRVQILDYQFVVNVFPSDTDDREVKQIFMRMNSSGYKLNGQELRNAEFFGAFKVRAESLATEQLDRWRKWRIFSNDDLARMDEVELTSELMILMIAGISDKNDKLIKDYYEKHDDEFKDGPEVSRRFKTVFETIESSFGDVMATRFSKRTLFYALFGAVYELQFGIGSGLGEKKVVPRNPTASQIEAIKKAGDRIATQVVPKAVLNSTTRRTTHVKERRTVKEYLLKNT